MGKDSPDVPDPYAVSDAQTKSNIETAKAQQKMGMTGQDTPWGSISYVPDPTSPSGYRAVQNLSPEEQALLGQRQDTQSLALGNVGRTIGSDWSLDAARGNEIADISRTFLDPQWAQADAALENDLLNRGIKPGSEQYENMKRQHGQQRDDAYNKMFLDAWSKANDAALTERNLPMQDYAILAGLGQNNPSMGFQNTPSPGVAPTDISGNIWNAYNAEAKKSSDAMGGLFGLGSAALGGWAQSGFALPSDKRFKTDIQKIGEDPRGWGIYKYRYRGAEKNAESWQVGFMAQEVEKFRPDAVVTSKSTGLKFVNYEALAQ